jgi:hypothetical protein
MILNQIRSSFFYNLGYRRSCCGFDSKSSLSG